MISQRTLSTLPARLAATREKRGVGERTAAAQIGIHRSTLRRVEAGEEATTSVLIKILEWLDGG